MKTENPFIIKGYKGPRYFCDREAGDEEARFGNCERTRRYPHGAAPLW